jgi:hypothetical protein
MNKELITKMVMITPESAEELLALNKENRPLNKKTVDWYARQMESGQWTISGQTLSISDKNTLLDGQHRLAAIIQSGVSLLLNIAYNVPTTSFVNYDSAKQRGLSDVFAIEKVSNFCSIASIIAKYNAFKKGEFACFGIGNTFSKGGVVKDRKLTNQEALFLYKSNAELFQEIHLLSKSCADKMKLFVASQIGSFMYYLIVDLGHDKKKVFSFFRQLFFNENIENKSIYYLREKLIKGSIGQYKMVPRLKYIYLVKCWNCYTIGKEMKIYSFNDSEIIPKFL